MVKAQKIQTTMIIKKCDKCNREVNDLYNKNSKQVINTSEEAEICDVCLKEYEERLKLETDNLEFKYFKKKKRAKHHKTK